MRRRGFTLIESVLALSLTALVIGAITAVHIAVVHGLGVQSAHFATQRQAQTLLDTIDQVATQSTGYTIVTVSSAPCLKLTMPATCTDTNSDTLPDQCTPQRLTKTGLEEWGAGYRVWFYKGDATGRPFLNGPCVWIGMCTTDATPSAAWLTGTFATGKIINKSASYNTIDLLTFASAGTYKFTVSITDSVIVGNLTERKTSTTDTTLTDTSSIARVFFVRGWRK